MKWFYFTLGFLPAVIIVMVTVLLISDTGIVAAASPRMSMQGESLVMVPAGTGTAAGGGPGSGIATMNSMVWIVYQRRPSDRDRKLLGKGFDGDRFTVGTYRAQPYGGWSRQGKVDFIASRDITYDLKLISLDQKGAREVQDLRRAWEDAIKKFEKKGGR